MSENVTDTQLQSIATLAQDQLYLEKKIVGIEAELAIQQAHLKKIQEELLPEAMMAVGLESFVLKDGSSIHVNKFYSGSIPPERASEALAWLRSHELGALIKRKVECVFGMGEDEKAQMAVDALRQLGAAPADKQGVHPMTLKSLIRERLEGGQELPSELFGVFVGNRTKITPAKK